MSEIDLELDVQGLNCPLPILKAKKALSALEAGQVLKVVATDPGSLIDFTAFAKKAGHGLLEASEENGRFTYKIKKAAD